MAREAIIGEPGLTLQGDGVDVGEQLYTRVVQPVCRAVLDDQGQDEWLRLHSVLVAALLGQLGANYGMGLARTVATSALKHCAELYADTPAPEMH